MKEYKMKDTNGDIYTIWAEDAEDASRQFEDRKHVQELNTKWECEEYGGIWVPSFHKKDGTKVRSYCRWGLK
jgi:hypothetical protein